jgi:hypothetical protein
MGSCTTTVGSFLVSIALVGCSPVSGSAPSSLKGGNSDQRQHSEQPYKTVSLRGRVVWTAEALEGHFGIRTASDARENSLALDAEDGRVYPLVEDAPGRAFRQDPRLREREVELFARYFPTTGMIQVIRTHFIKPEGKFLIDYWCDVCSISMTELGDCSCCQQPNRLRERLLEESSSGAAAE